MTKLDQIVEALRKHPDWKRPQVEAAVSFPVVSSQMTKARERLGLKPKPGKRGKRKATPINDWVEADPEVNRLRKSNALLAQILTLVIAEVAQ